jgi:hypothetical protein
MTEPIVLNELRAHIRTQAQNVPYVAPIQTSLYMLGEYQFEIPRKARRAGCLLIYDIPRN